MAIGMTIGKMVLGELFSKLTKGKGKVAEKVLDVALEATGLSKSDPEQDIMDALSADPEALAAVKVKAAEVAIAEINQETALTQAEIQDRISAREMESPERLYLTVLAFLTFFASIGLLIYVLNRTTPVDDIWVATIGSVIGVSGGWVTQIMNFNFGSSMGSKQKTEDLARIGR